MLIGGRRAAQVHALEIEEYMRDFSAPFFRRAGVADKARQLLASHWRHWRLWGCGPPATGAPFRNFSTRVKECLSEREFAVLPSHEVGAPTGLASRHRAAARVRHACCACCPPCKAYS